MLLLQTTGRTTFGEVTTIPSTASPRLRLRGARGGKPSAPQHANNTPSTKTPMWDNTPPAMAGYSSPQDATRRHTGRMGLPAPCTYHTYKSGYRRYSPSAGRGQGGVGARAGAGLGGRGGVPGLTSLGRAAAAAACRQVCRGIMYNGGPRTRGRKYMPGTLSPNHF